MYYGFSLATLAFAAYTTAWPQSHINSTTGVLSGSSSIIKSSSISTKPIHPSGSLSRTPSGSISFTSHTLSTGVPLPRPSGSGSGNHGHHTTGASGTGHGGVPIDPTQSVPPKTTRITIPGIPSTTTETHLVTATSTTIVTKFVPCSTPIATQSDTTYYSSSLTTSVITSTTTTVLTEYTVLCPTPKGYDGHSKDGSQGQDVYGQASSSGQGSNSGSYDNSCPSASTVYHTVYVTVNAPAGSLQTDISSSPSSPDSPDSQHKPPFQSQSNKAPFPQPSNQHTAPLPSGSGTATLQPSSTGAYYTRSLSTGSAKPTYTIS